MTVKLESGMYGIRRDGERVGPAETNGVGRYAGTHKFRMSSLSYTAKGIFCSDGIQESRNDIIAAGYPWADLGAQVGDTVKQVWSGYAKTNWEFQIPQGDCRTADEASLYVIVKRAQPAEDAIEWGDWVDWTLGLEAPVGDHQQQFIAGLAQYRLPKPKPPVVETCTVHAYWPEAGVGHNVRLTRTNGVVTAEVLP